MSTIVGDNDAALDFLRKVYPDGPWVLTAIHPDRKAIETRTFRPATEADCLAWLTRYNGERNLYWAVNKPTRDLNKKAEREDIKEVAYLHVDVDPRAGEDLVAERDRILGLFGDRLPDGLPEPTVVLFSGGGYQAFWKLEAPIEINGDLAKAEDAKRYNQQLELLFGADNCHNIDRIMRLPGTWNLPDERKLKKGRVRALAKLETFDPSRVYPLSEFKQADLTKEAAASGPFAAPPIGDAVKTADPADLNVPDRLKIIMVQGHHPDEPKEGDNSRSAWVFDFCCNMIRAGVTDEVTLGILLDPAYEISKSVLEKGKPHSYAVRQIESARAHVALDVDFEMDKGRIRHTAKNILIAMQKLGVSVRHDVFSDRLLINGLPNYSVINDAALTRLRLAMEERFQLLPGKELFLDVVMDAARHSPFHPVREYLDALRWDGEPRIDRWLTTYGGAEETPYSKAVGQLVLMAAVRRVRSPGCKFDEMLVLECSQGTDKSSALAILAKNDDWFTDDMPLNTPDGAKVIERLNGKWIVEAAELKGMRNGQIDHLKAFLSRRVDIGRAAYARLANEVPRQSIFIGTTNNDNYLKDDTGNRRFWPVKIARFDLASLRRDVDQLWAEAAHREAMEGASIRLDPSLYAYAAVEQAARKAEEPWTGVLDDVLGALEGKVRGVELWSALALPTGQLKQADSERLRAAMAELGWEKKKARFGPGDPQVAFVKGRAQHPRRVMVERDSFGNARAFYEDVRVEPPPF